MKKVGRNDPCPCGSGRKYKNCHLRLEPAGEDSNRLWAQMHELSGRLPTELLRFAVGRWGRGLLDEAWQEFTLFDEDGGFDPESIHLPVFMPWFFYDWDPDPAETAVPEDDLELFPVASAYLRRRGGYLDALTRRYLEAVLESSFSFLEILEVEAGRGFRARDVLSGWEGFVVEKTGSATLEMGGILFAQAVTLDGLTTLDGCAPIAFPPLEKAPLIDLRNQIKEAHNTVDAEVLCDYRFEMLEIYHATAGRLLNPQLPQLSNTDGDPLVFCRVTYEVPSPLAAFEALGHLSGRPRQELLGEATYDSAGELHSVGIPWIRRGRSKAGFDHLSLGRITIEGSRVTAEVNSEERAERFRKLADKALPDGSRYISTVVEPVEAALAAHGEARGESPADADDLHARPEVQVLLQKHLAEYYRGWLDLEIPALGGKTPRQAVTTPDGREMVEALMLDIERERGPGATPGPKVIADLRASLGLAASEARR